jgi:hypothetical protein
MILHREEDFGILSSDKMERNEKKDIWRRNSTPHDRPGTGDRNPINL